MTRDPFEGQPVICHDGGPCPVPPDTVVRVCFPDGQWSGRFMAKEFFWDGVAGSGRIVQYQIARTEPKPRKWGHWIETTDQARLCDYMVNETGMQVERTKNGLKIRYRVEK